MKIRNARTKLQSETNRRRYFNKAEGRSEGAVQDLFEFALAKRKLIKGE